MIIKIVFQETMINFTDTLRLLIRFIRTRTILACRAVLDPSATFALAFLAPAPVGPLRAGQPAPPCRSGLQLCSSMSFRLCSCTGQPPPPCRSGLQLCSSMSFRCFCTGEPRRHAVLGSGLVLPRPSTSILAPSSAPSAQQRRAGHGRRCRGSRRRCWPARSRRDRRIHRS
jgi:hypothetical protein